MLRRYARVLRGRRSVTPLTPLVTRLADMQLRARSRSAPSPKAGAVAPLDAGSSAKSATGKRTRASPKATTKAIDVIKEEVREGEGVGATAQRRSPRQRVKREQLTVAVKAERTVGKEEAAEEEDEEEEDGEDEEDEEDEDAGEGKPKAAKKRRRVRVVKRGADGKPERWEAVLGGIQQMRASQVADVDVAGVEVMFEEGRFAPHVARFHVLISAMLSSQTKDPVNAAAMKRLIARGLSVSEILAIDEKELAQLIHPVGFYNNKARYIKQVAQLLMDAAAEAGAEVVDIPDTFDALVALPGVGPKMAHLVMSCAWDNTVGICVDTHVHRISNRLGWVKTWNKANPKSQDPEKTRKELEEWLPREHWGPINVTLVGFGQTVCLPRGPKCSECAINHLCPSAFSSAI